MKLLLLYSFLLATLTSFAQKVKIQTLKQVNPISKEVYIFPKVIIANSPVSTQKVNYKLRETVLFLSSITKDKNIFDSIWTTKDQSAVISNLSFKISEINSSLISLSISGEGCGAYCETFNYYFTFNTKTGNQLTLDSLFTKKGITTVIKFLNDSKKKKLVAKLKEVNHALGLSKTKNNAEENERLSEMLAMYKECFGNSINLADVPGIRFLSKGGILTVYTERCSAHYNMALDELWTFKYQLALKNSGKLLNKFGLSLLN